MWYTGCLKYSTIFVQPFGSPWLSSAESIFWELVSLGMFSLQDNLFVYVTYRVPYKSQVLVLLWTTPIMFCRHLFSAMPSLFSGTALLCFNLFFNLFNENSSVLEFIFYVVIFCKLPLFVQSNYSQSIIGYDDVLTCAQFSPFLC